MKARSTLLLSVVSLTLIAMTGCTVGTEAEYASIDYSPTATRTLVTTLGTDTLSVEEYTRTGSEISGVLVATSPSTILTTFNATLSADGTIEQLSAERSVPKSDGSREVGLSWTVSLSDGEATITREGGQNPGTSTMDAPNGTIPTLGRTSAAGFVFEQIGRQLDMAGSATAETWLLSPTSTEPRSNGSKTVSADTISMDFFGSPRYGWFGEGDQLLGASGHATTMKTEARRSLPLDVPGFANRWAAKDEAGQGIGTPSPGAELSQSVSGTNLEIIYSQPAKRGRDIWGGLVPYGEIWRTGANAATTFSTSEDIVVEGTAIPAGSYTLWTTFTNDSQTLIFNSETGQWGTSYDSSLDFAKVSMTRSAAAAFSERFTISVEESDGGGVLILEWDETRFSVQFSVE